MAESKNNNIKTIISEVNEATKEIRKQLFHLESGDENGEESFDRTFSERSKLYFTIQKVQFEALIKLLDKGYTRCDVEFIQQCVDLINGFSEDIGCRWGRRNSYDRLSMLLSKLYSGNRNIISKLISECEKMLKFCKGEIEKAEKKATASRFIKTRIIEIVGQFYKEDRECDDEQVAIFLKRNEEQIENMIEEILDEYEPDYDNVYYDDHRLGMMIMDEYDTLE